ncbi:MAG: DUF456 domain-containing protein [Anaerolineales bacterium]|nr:DUF456 domain-containing protein [Anaerolineales bacterium]
MTDIVITILLGLAMLIGLASTIIPVIPDLGLILISALGYGLLVGWGENGWWLFAIIVVLGLGGQAAEMVVSGMGARRGGASWLSTFGGLAAGVIGLLVLGPIGLIAGLLIGTFLLEFMRHNNTEEALRAMFGMGVGYGASFIVKFLLGLVMIGVWIAWIFIK